MLPPQAKSYFDRLMEKAVVDLWAQLAGQQKDFSSSEFARGRAPYGAGFAARLSELYKASLKLRAQGIVDTLKKVHGSFNTPLNADVDAQLHDWAERALLSAYDGLESAFQRHLQSRGDEPQNASGLDYTYALARATVANGLSEYLWELRNVPAMRPQSEPPAGGHLTINNNGTIGVLQTGVGATANVQQQWSHEDAARLLGVLDELKAALERARDIEPSLRDQVIDEVKRTTAEIRRDQPSKGSVLQWLDGINAVVGTVASVQSAWKAVKDLAGALDLPI